MWRMRRVLKSIWLDMNLKRTTVHVKTPFIFYIIAITLYKYKYLPDRYIHYVFSRFFFFSQACVAPECLFSPTSWEANSGAQLCCMSPHAQTFALFPSLIVLTCFEFPQFAPYLSSVFPSQLWSIVFLNAWYAGMLCYICTMSGFSW